MDHAYKVIVIDDEPPARDLLITFIRHIPDLVCIDTCSNAMQGLQAIQAKKPDLIFLDIKMPEVNGLDLLSLSIQYRPEVVLTTAFPEYALQSYDYSVLDYLVKPIAFDRFLRAIAKLREKREITRATAEKQTQQVYKLQYNAAADLFKPMSDVESIWLREEKRLLQIPYIDVLYVEGLKDYIKVHLDDRLIISHLSLGKAEQTFTEPNFIRIHRSYIVRLSAIRVIEGNTLTMSNHKELPIGPNYREGIKKYISLFG